MNRDSEQLFSTLCDEFAIVLASQPDFAPATGLTVERCGELIRRLIDEGKMRIVLDTQQEEFAVFNLVLVNPTPLELERKVAAFKLEYGK